MRKSLAAVVGAFTLTLSMLVMIGPAAAPASATNDQCLSADGGALLHPPSGSVVTRNPDGSVTINVPYALQLALYWVGPTLHLSLCTLGDLSCPIPLGALLSPPSSGQLIVRNPDGSISIYPNNAISYAAAVATYGVGPTVAYVDCLIP